MGHIRDFRPSRKWIAPLLASLVIFGCFVQADSRAFALSLGNIKVDKILFLGNSITNHGAAPFWKGGNWGMAASSMDKDYVHVLTNSIAQRVGGTPTILPISLGTRGNFEVNYASYDAATELRAELDFAPAIVVVAIGENVPDFKSPQEQNAFRAAFTSLLTLFRNNTKPSPTIFVKSTSMINPTKDALMREATAAVGCVWVDQSSIGIDPLNFAYSEPLYANNTVVNTHPGDRGMKAIADSLFSAIAAHGDRKAASADDALPHCRSVSRQANDSHSATRRVLRGALGN